VKKRLFFGDTTLGKWSRSFGYASISPPCLTKKLTLFPSKPKTPTSSKIFFMDVWLLSCSFQFLESHSISNSFSAPLGTMKE
jgi:hypothetical protein